MSTTLLTALIVGPAALVVIALFLVMWRERTTPQAASVAVVSGVVLAGWLVGTAILARRGFYFPPPPGRLPPVGVQLIVAMLVLAAWLIASPTLRSLLSNQQNLIRLNVWRLVGAIFLALMVTGQVPALWALPAGIGDVLVGATAFWVARRVDEPGGERRAIIFNYLGLLDLVVAITLGTSVTPGPTQLFYLTPNGELLTRFPLVLVPTFLVPLAAMLHVVSLWQLHRGSWGRTGAGAGAGASRSAL